MRIDSPPAPKSRPAFQPRRAVSSAVEHCFHTAGVTGSIPVPPTISKHVVSLMSERPEARLALTLAIILVAPLGVLRDANAAGSSVQPPAAAQLIAELGLRVDAHPVRERSGWRPPRAILVSAELHEQLPLLRATAPAVKFIELSASTPERDLAAADAAIGYCSPELLARAQKLAWIQSLGAGVERCLGRPGVREGRTLLTNMQRAAGASMAEHALALMLALTTFPPCFATSSRDAGVGPARATCLPLRISTAGRSAHRGIGRHRRRGGEARARARHARDRHPQQRREGPRLRRLRRPVRRTAGTRGQADVVVNAPPLTPATTGMFNAAFSRDEPGALFPQRRPRQQRGDRRSGRRAAGAARSAAPASTSPSPNRCPPGHPLWRCRTSSSRRTSADADRAAGAQIVRENLRRYLAGEAMSVVRSADIEPASRACC